MIDTVTRHRHLVMLGVVRTMVDVDDDPWELDEVSAAIVDALDAFDETRRKAPLRIPKGFEGGGRFRSISDRIFERIQEWAKGDLDNPFGGDEFTREHLRKAAKERGLTLRRGATFNEIANALLDDVRKGKGDRKPDADAPDEKPAKKAAPKKAPAKKAAPKKAAPKATSRKGAGSGRDLTDDHRVTQRALEAGIDPETGEWGMSGGVGSQRGGHFSSDGGYQAHLALAREQGFDGPPDRVLTPARQGAWSSSDPGVVEWDRLEDEGWRPLFRGFGWGSPGKTGEEMADQYMYGPLHVGGGLGLGTNMSNDFDAADYYAREDLYTRIPGGRTGRYLLSPDARVISYADAIEQRDAYLASLPDGPEHDAERKVYEDPGTFAMAKGYDAMVSTHDDAKIVKRGTEEWVIFNRTKIVAWDDNPDGAKEYAERNAPTPDSVAQARARQDAIDSARRYADTAAELDELLANDVSDEALLSRLDARARREGIEADVAPVLAALRGAGKSSSQLDVREIGEGLDLSLIPNTVLDDVQAMLDGDDRHRIGSNSPAAIGRYLEKWAHSSSGPYYHSAVMTGVGQGDPGREAEAARLRARGDEWVKLAERLKATRRPARGKPAGADRAEAKRLAADLLARQGITQDGQAGDSGRYDPKLHQPIDGSLRAGQAVEVVRPGMVLDRDGEKIRVRKAVVEAVGDDEAPERPTGHLDVEDNSQIDPETLAFLQQANEESKRRLKEPKPEPTPYMRRFERFGEIGGGAGATTFHGSGAMENARDRFAKGENPAEVATYLRYEADRLQARQLSNEAKDVMSNLNYDRATLDAHRDGDVRRLRALADRVEREALEVPSAPDPEATRDALDLKTVPQLKAMLRDLNAKRREQGLPPLPMSGRKRELVDRLVDDMNRQDTESLTNELIAISRRLAAGEITKAQAAKLRREATRSDDMDAETRDRVLAFGEMRFADEMRVVDANELKRYWTVGEGLKRWRFHPHPWTTLRNLLRKHVGPGRAERMASEWFHVVFGYWPGHRKGDNPVGPG